jgi:hypothetical protein
VCRPYYAELPSDKIVHRAIFIEAMNPFPWPPVDLGLKLALAPRAWFDPVLEWYTPPSDFSHGTYFGLARMGARWR